LRTSDVSLSPSLRAKSVEELCRSAPRRFAPFLTRSPDVYGPKGSFFRLEASTPWASVPLKINAAWPNWPIDAGAPPRERGISRQAKGVACTWQRFGRGKCFLPGGEARPAAKHVRHWSGRA